MLLLCPDSKFSKSVKDLDAPQLRTWSHSEMDFCRHHQVENKSLWKLHWVVTTAIDIVTRGDKTRDQNVTSHGVYSHQQREDKWGSCPDSCWGSSTWLTPCLDFYVAEIEENRFLHFEKSPCLCDGVTRTCMLTWYQVIGNSKSVQIQM